MSRPELFRRGPRHRPPTFTAIVAARHRPRLRHLQAGRRVDPGAASAHGHILDGEQAALQDTNDHFLANIQKDGTYSVVPRIPGGEITPEKLIAIGEVARDFGLYTKITGGQRIDLFGARVEQLPAIWRRLVDAGFESGHAYGKALRTVKSCVGSTWCRYGVQDSVGLAIELELRYRGCARRTRSSRRSPAAPASAPRRAARTSASSPPSRAGTSTSAATAAFTPRHADLLADDLDRRTLVRYIDRFLMFYIRTADRLQRTAAWIEAIEGGLDHLRDVIIDDTLGIARRARRGDGRHVEAYDDEWRATLDDPQSCARFVSFVNAPDTADPEPRLRLRARAAPPGYTRGTGRRTAADGSPLLASPPVIAGPRLEVVTR